jgi:serine protease
MRSWQLTHRVEPAPDLPQTLSYGGGNGGAGVLDGHARVYLVFYGSQWGAERFDTHGDATFSGDPDSAAPVAQDMFRGVGTGGELWSADLTQWCDGGKVPAGATSCPIGARFIPYQSGGVLAGVWYDGSAPSPAGASGKQLAQEAVNAAAHFGNTTTAANRHAYYVILSPHGTDPDGYLNQFCAWHDDTDDATLTGGAASSPYGDLAFSNQPYLMDTGASCGAGFVNSPGLLDGWTITLGHEWHEAMSDQFPAGGWSNHTSSPYSGEEDADECAWLTPGTPGGAADVAMGTGRYAEQADWSNDTDSCTLSHTIVDHGSDTTVTVADPGHQSGTVGVAVSLQIHATDSSRGRTLKYTATGLPAGTSISRTGLISGTPTASGTSSVTVTATDSAGATGRASFLWKISPASGSCTPTQLIGNPGFEDGARPAPWTATAGVINDSAAEPPHSGRWDAWLDGYTAAHTDSLAQTVRIPARCSRAALSFWLHVDTAKPTRRGTDTLKVQVTHGTVKTTLATFSNLDAAASGYTRHSFVLPQVNGTSITLTFVGTQNDSAQQTSFVIDDTALQVS